MNHDEMIAVIQAHKDGKKIEFKRKSAAAATGWDIFKYSHPSWDFSSFDYRIKKEPIELYAVMHDDNRYVRTIRPDRLTVEEYAMRCIPVAKIVHFREVL
jgi:hypothetical protein